MNSSGYLALAVELDGAGAHPASWRTGGTTASDPASITALVCAVERAGFIAATFADPTTRSEHPTIRGRLDPVEVAAFAAAVTDSIGVVPVVGTIHSEPFHLANQLASTDFASKGRAGWIAESADSQVRANAYSADVVTDSELLHSEGTEVIAAVRRLWDTWEDGVAIADAETGYFLDPDRLHYANFVGEHFSVKGPSVTPRPPQGQLVVFAPFGSVDPAVVDVHLVTGSCVDVITTQTGRAQAATPGRGHLVFADLEVALDTETANAVDRVSALDADASWRTDGVLRHVGSVDGLLALLTELARYVDGVRIHPAVLSVDVPILVDEVLPELRKRRVLQVPSAGSSLRATLGLSRPVNIFTAARIAARLDS